MLKEKVNGLQLVILKMSKLNEQGVVLCKIK